MSIFDAASKTRLPTADAASPGRAQAMPVPTAHYVNGNPLKGPFPAHMRQALFGMDCFWGVERKFWQVKGVVTTAAGYAAGITPNPSYQEVCTSKFIRSINTLFPKVEKYQKDLRTPRNSAQWYHGYTV
jgi:peptide-methionine (S)-S-oxide reductase